MGSLANRKDPDDMSHNFIKKVNEYNHEIPQSHIADRPTHGSMRKSHITLTVTQSVLFS